MTDQKPEEAATRERAYQILAANVHGINNRPHGAQVACGVQGCAEPCLCGGSRSHHIAGMACDLGPDDAMQKLDAKLKAGKTETLDQYLARFGLARPLMKGTAQDEAWHIEQAR